MEKIHSYEQWSSIIEKFKKINRKTYSNFYFMPNEMKKIISCRNVLYILSDTYLLFYIDEESYYRLCYFIAQDIENLTEQLDKVVCADIVIRKEKLCQLDKEIQIIRCLGLDEYKKYTRMTTEIVESKFCVTDYEFSYGDIKYGKEILGLWQRNLDIYSTPLPFGDEINGLINNNHLYYIKDKNKIIGAVYFGTLLRTCTLQHLVIAPMYRRQGLGKKLIEFGLKQMYSNGIRKCNLWVDIQNISAYKSYINCGFKEDGLYCIQLKSDYQLG